METNNARAPLDARPPSAGGKGPEPSGPGQGQLPPRPPLARVDSRSAFPPQAQSPRLGGPPQFQPQQQRPLFQPGGPVTNPPQNVPRPGTPAPRGPLPVSQPGQPQTRPHPPPLRPVGPQSFAQQQGPRPLQSPTSGQPPQRIPAPNNLQFGPRQPSQFGTAITPDGARPQFNQQQPNGGPRNILPTGPGSVPGLPPKQQSQGSFRIPDSSNSHLNKPVNLDNLNYTNGGQNATKPEIATELPGIPKNRSYSIAAAPGAPSPLKMDDDRRKSVSGLGGRMDDFTSRTPGLGLIQEGKIDSKDNIRGSKESVRSEASNEGSRDIIDRPESRLSGSKMTDSFMGSLPSAIPKKNFDDNDDVVLQNNTTQGKIQVDMSQTQNKSEFLDRSPSLTRSDESPESKLNNASLALANKSQSATPEPQHPKTPKSEIKQDIRDTKPLIMVSNKPSSMSPVLDTKQVPNINKKPSELNTTLISTDSKKSLVRKTTSAPKSRQKDGDNDSGVDESTQGNDLNGSPGSPNKKLPSKLPMKEKSSSSIKHSLSRSSSKSATAKTPENPLPIEKKKLPMNKVQVGNAPSPNIKAVKSKIGSLENATYKPGGGRVKIENRKLEFGNVTPRIAAKNEAYMPSGGAKKITSTKLEWNAKSKIGSLQNTSYKPGGGDKKIETVKLDFKEKAKPKVASTVNITHKPGGGTVKATVAKNGAKSIENQKLEFKAQSKVGSLDNVKYKPGGGDIKIFDDKDYIKQISSPAPGSLGQSRQEIKTKWEDAHRVCEGVRYEARRQHARGNHLSPRFVLRRLRPDYYSSVEEWAAEERPRPLSRCRSARAPRTPRTPRALSPRKALPHGDVEADSRVMRNNERNTRASARPVSARDPPRSACSRRGSVLGQRPAFTVY